MYRADFTGDVKSTDKLVINVIGVLFVVDSHDKS